MSSRKKVILINKIDAGSYTKIGENIGHEIINQFVSDDGTRYLYITKGGSIDFRKYDVESILFVRNSGIPNTNEVVALGVGISEIPKGKDVDPRERKYGSVKLKTIFAYNTYKGSEDDLQPINCMAENVLIPNTRLFITLNNSLPLDKWPGSVCLNTKKKVITSESLRGFYSEDDDKSAFDQLKGLIGNKSLWLKPKESINAKIESAINPKKPSQPTFLEIIGKQYDELSFSNLLAYYFQYNPKAFVIFAHKVLEIADFSESFIVKREEKHIDLWIEDDRHVIVIENKIKSGINGINEDKKLTQLDNYRQTVFAQFADSEGRLRKQTRFYVFKPEYNFIDLNAYDHEERQEYQYQPISYKKLYEFFHSHSSSYESEPHFTDFLRDLEFHTVTTAEQTHRIMEGRFLKMIEKARHELNK